jgi:hypothetical protein
MKDPNITRESKARRLMGRGCNLFIVISLILSEENTAKAGNIFLRIENRHAKK